jgi:hypothetical protein
MNTLSSYPYFYLSAGYATGIAHAVLCRRYSICLTAAPHGGEVGF